jgi:hypothetical protein
MNPKYLFRTAAFYGVFAALFSLIGLVLPFASPPDDPLASLSIEHVVGHIVFGMMAAFATLSFRYIIASGLFAIALDADHLVNYAGFDIVIRMGHSLSFALLIPVLMMLCCGKKDYLLGAISFAAVFSHLAFDTLLGRSSSFPIFVPFNDFMATFSGTDWIFLQLVAVMSVLVVVLAKKKAYSIKIKSD